MDVEKVVVTLVEDITPGDVALDGSVSPKTKECDSCPDMVVFTLLRAAFWEKWAGSVSVVASEAVCTSRVV